MVIQRRGILAGLYCTGTEGDIFALLHKDIQYK